MYVRNSIAKSEKDAQKNDYPKGEAIANVYIAKVLIDLGENLEVLKFLNSDENALNKEEYIPRRAEVARLKGRYYSNLNLSEMKIKQYRELLRYSALIEKEEAKNLSTLWSYQNLAVIYKETKDTDSVEHYLRKQFDHVVNFDEAKHFMDLISIYSDLADFYTKK